MNAPSKTTPARQSRPCRFGILPSLLAAASLALPAAGAAAGPALTHDPPGADWGEGLVNFDFSNYHFTPRGLNLQDKGLVFQPLVRFDWLAYQNTETNHAWINRATLTTAMFNDFDTVRSGAAPGNWNEIDWILGPNVVVFKDWGLESPFIAFKSETGSYPTAWAWNPKLTYHDRWFGQFSLNPYVEFFDELENKITIVLDPATAAPGYYGAMGFTPAYVSTRLPVTLELPAYILIPSNRFYQRANGSGGGAGLGLVSAALRLTVRLGVLGPAFDSWSVYGGVQYDYLNNPGLLDGNQLSGAGLNRQRNFLIFHGGLTVHF